MSRSSDTDRSPLGRSSFRSPLNWLLLPLIAGYLAGQALAVEPGLLLALSLAATVSGGWLAWHDRTAAWQLAFPAAVFLAGWSWWLAAVPEPPAVWHTLPPRETTLRIEVVRSFRSSDLRYWRGVARIREAPPLVEELQGQRLIFSTRRDPTYEGSLEGGEWLLRGVIGRLRAPSEAPDPFIDYWRSQGVHFRLRQGSLMAPPLPPPQWRQRLEAVRADWAAILTRAPPSQAARSGVLGAMLLGDRSLLEAEQKDAFLLSGTMHLFAVSGLHVMAVGGTLFGLGALLRLPRRLNGGLSLLLLGIYVLVIGWPPSAVRAYLMLLFYALGRGIARQSSPFPAVVASAVVLLVWEPTQLTSLGFQLSYTVVASILLIGLPLAQAIEQRWPAPDPLAPPPTRFRRWLTRRARPLGQGLAVSFAATLASAPLIALHFEVFTPGAILLNPLLIPLTALVVVDAVAVLLSGMLGLEGLSQFFAHGGWLMISGMEWLVEGALRLPGIFSLRQWTGLWLAPTLTLGFLLLALLAHERSVVLRWPPLLRLGLPLAVVLAGLLIGTRLAPVPLG